MTECPKQEKARGPGFVVLSTVPDGDIQLPEKSAGIDPEAQLRAALRRLFDAVQAGRSGRQERQSDARRLVTPAHSSSEKIAFESRATSTNLYSSLVQ